MTTGERVEKAGRIGRIGRNVKAGRNRIVGASCIVPIVILYRR